MVAWTPSCKLTDALSGLGCQCWDIEPEEENENYKKKRPPITRWSRDVCPINDKQRQRGAIKIGVVLTKSVFLEER